MARNLFAKLSLEDELSSSAPVANSQIEPEDVVDAISVNDETTESEREINANIDTLEEANDTLDDLQEIDNNAADALNEDRVNILSGEPINNTDSNNDVEVPKNLEVAAAVAQEALKRVYRKLGCSSKFKVTFEEIHSSPISALKLAREEAQEAGKSLWERIKAFFIRVWETIKAFFGNVQTQINKNVDIINKLLEKLKDTNLKGGKPLSEELVNLILETGVPLYSNREPQNIGQYIFWYNKYLSQFVTYSEYLSDAAAKLIDNKPIDQPEVELFLARATAVVDGDLNALNEPVILLAFPKDENVRNKNKELLLTAATNNCITTLNSLLSKIKKSEEDIKNIKTAMDKIAKAIKTSKKEDDGQLAKKDLLPKILTVLTKVSKSYGKDLLRLSKVLIRVVKESIDAEKDNKSETNDTTKLMTQRRK